MPIAQRTRIAGLKIRVDRVIYTTITLMAVLIIYDGWEQLRFWNVVTVIVGPILAIFLSHVFGAALGSRVALGRPLTRHEHRTVFAEECRFLLIAVPPLVILVILAVAGVSYTRIIQVIVLTGMLSLGVWGGVAGRRAGLTGWPLLVPITYGLFVGAIILTSGFTPARPQPLPSIALSGSMQRDSAGGTFLALTAEVLGFIRGVRAR
ncbi:MAG: hypothetical protein WAN44_01250 [Propionibacteriaceae bacterium]